MFLNITTASDLAAPYGINLYHSKICQDQIAPTRMPCTEIMENMEVACRLRINSENFHDH